MVGDEQDQEAGDVHRPEEALAPDVPGEGPESAPGSASEAPEFDVTSGEDLVEDLPDESEVPVAVRRTFWRTVLLVKVALLATTLAVLLAYFRGQYLFAAGLGAVGLLAGGRAVLAVRSYQRSESASRSDAG